MSKTTRNGSKRRVVRDLPAKVAGDLAEAISAAPSGAAFKTRVAGDLAEAISAAPSGAAFKTRVTEPSPEEQAKVKGGLSYQLGQLNANAVATSPGTTTNGKLLESLGRTGS